MGGWKKNTGAGASAFLTIWEATMSDKTKTGSIHPSFTIQHASPRFKNDLSLASFESDRIRDHTLETRLRRRRSPLDHLLDDVLACGFRNV